MEPSYSFMSSYLSNFIPSIPFSYSNYFEPGETKEEGNGTAPPHIEYLAIFNPSLLGKNVESTDQLSKQIICFIEAEGKHNGENYQMKSRDLDEQVKIVGLIRGLLEFGDEFYTEKTGDTAIIRASELNIYVKTVEEDYYIIVSVRFPYEEKSKPPLDALIPQIMALGYNTFLMIKGPLGFDKSKIQETPLREEIAAFWKSFVVGCNENFYMSKSIPGNFLNYRGFIEALEGKCAVKILKRASEYMDNEFEVQMNQLVNENDKISPRAMFLAHISSLSPKKNGIIYSSGNTMQGAEEIESDELLKLYDLMESLYMRGKLNTETLTSHNYQDLFSVAVLQKDSVQSEGNGIADNAVPAREIENHENSLGSTLLEPLRYTNELLVLPISNTLSGVVNLNSITNYGMNLMTTFDQLRDEATNHTNTVGVVEAQVEDNHGVNDPETNSSAQSENEDSQDLGEFLVGLAMNDHGDVTVVKRAIFLRTRITSEGGISHEFKEYLLVIYRDEELYIALCYDSCEKKLDDPEFYYQIKSTLFFPMRNEILNAVMSKSMCSVISFPRFINEFLKLNNRNLKSEKPIRSEIDDNFYFIIYDHKSKHIKSSLPYIPVFPRLMSQPRKKESLEQMKESIRYHSLIFSLHRKLNDIFLLNSAGDFFSKKSLKEFFHKFSGSKTIDWMLYYFRYKSKFLVIIKAHHHNLRKDYSVELPASGEIPPNLLDHISNFAHLDFLENLGDDVKLWFENFTRNEEI